MQLPIRKPSQRLQRPGEVVAVDGMGYPWQFPYSRLRSASCRRRDREARAGTTLRQSGTVAGTGPPRREPRPLFQQPVNRNTALLRSYAERPEFRRPRAYDRVDEPDSRGTVQARTTEGIRGRDPFCRTASDGRCATVAVGYAASKSASLSDFAERDCRTDGQFAVAAVGREHRVVFSPRSRPRLGQP